MSLLIDTSILIDLEKSKKEIVEKILEFESIYPITPKISFISSFEFRMGLINKSEKNMSNAMNFMNQFKTVHTTELTIKNLIKLKSKYELPLADLLIAAQTMEHGCLLVTKDKDFQQIEEIDKIIL